MNFVNKTFAETFIENAKKHEHNNAIYYEGKKITYKSLLKNANLINAFFQNIGLKQNDIITLVCPNTPEAVASFIAASMYGLRIHLIHPLANEETIKSELRNKDSKLLIAVSLFVNSYKSILVSDTPILILGPENSLNPIKKVAFKLLNHKTISVDKKRQNLFFYEDLKKELSLIKHYDNKMGRVLLSSGGTSGSPKTIELSDYAIMSLIATAPKILSCKEEDIASKTMLAALPMFHGFGLVMGVFALLFFGGSIGLLPKFRTKKVISLLASNHLNIIIGVPAMFEALLRNRAFDGKKLKNLDVCFIGGDFIAPTLLERFNQRIKDNEGTALLLEGYGLTETVTVLSVNTLKQNKVGSVGKPLDVVDVKIIDENHTLLPHDVKGEILIAGDTLMNGYFEDEKTTFISINNKKYINSGDIGYLDEDGYLYFVSRKKRIIKKQGFNIFPLEIEKYVSSLPDVIECAYLSKTKDSHVITHLFVHLSKKESNDESLILSNLKKKFYPYEIPDYIHLLDDFPKTNVGKINYIALEDSLS